MTNDMPIHLSNYQICRERERPQTEPSVVVPVWITQSSLDGLNALIHYCSGVENSGKGRLPGSFELVMFYRQLRSSIHEANDARMKELQAEQETES